MLEDVQSWACADSTHHVFFLHGAGDRLVDQWLHELQDGGLVLAICNLQYEKQERVVIEIIQC